MFKDLGKGLVAGAENHHGNDSEGLVLRSQFVNCTESGISIEAANAVNWWVWDSEFVDNRLGITNGFSKTGGMFEVYRSVFRRSTNADIFQGQTGFLSVRESVSIGSNMFFYAWPTGHSLDLITLQRNLILDPTGEPGTPVISVGNSGPLMMIDNVIRSRAGAVGPVVHMRWDGEWWRDLFAIGNTFTVAEPIKVDGTPNSIVREYDTQIADRSTIQDVKPSSPQAIRPKRQVFEVPANADGALVQQIIKTAAASSDPRPLTHFPPGDISVTETINIPANRAIELVGDSTVHSALMWQRVGAGPVLRLLGPSRATLRALTVDGATRATGIEIAQADQSNARVFIEGGRHSDSSFAGLFFDGVRNTRGELHGVDFWPPAGLAIRLHGSAQISFFGGGTAVPPNAEGIYEVIGGGKLLVTETWAEGSGARMMHLSDSGLVTFQGGSWAPGGFYKPHESWGLHVPSIVLDGFKGIASFLGIQLTMANPEQGIRIALDKPNSAALFLAVSGDYPGYCANVSTMGQVACLYTRSSDPFLGAYYGQEPEVGVASYDFLVSALKQTRTTRLGWTNDLPAKVTDVRLHRIITMNVTTGVHVIR